MGKENICSLDCLTFHLLFPVSQELGGSPWQQAPGVIQFLHKHDYTSKTHTKKRSLLSAQKKRIKKKEEMTVNTHSKIIISSPM